MNHLNKWLLIMVGCLLVINSLVGAANESPNLKMEQARQAYDQGDYQQAINYYQELLAAGYDDGALYYNLGNAAFKAGQLGESIAFYRRAAKRLPWDDDVEHNLNFARQLVKQPEKKNSPIDIVVEKIFLRISASQLSFLAVSAYLLLMVIIGLLILSKEHHALWNWGAAGLGLLFIFFAILASVRLVVDNNVKWGVIIVEQAQARNGPGDEYQVGFTIPEGREVRVLGNELDWLAIGLPQEGFKGWIKTDELWKD